MGTAAQGPAQSAPGNDPANLDEQAKRLAKEQLERLGAGYVARIDPQRRIVYVSAIDPGNFQRVTALLSMQHDLLRRQIFPAPLGWNVTVIFPTLNDYRRRTPLAKAAGFYHHPSRTLYSVSLSDVLLHEFTHALHHNDQHLSRQQHALWVIEGFATLFQRCKPTAAGLEPQNDWSLGDLQETVKAGKACKLAELMTMSQKAFLEKAETHYSQVRWVMMYLYRKGKLPEFYATYKATWAADATGRKALEKVFAQDLDKIEADWTQWLLELEPPWKPGYTVKARLGVRMKPCEDGVEITALLRGSAASQTHLLRPGDVVLAINAQQTPTPRDLTAAVQACKPGQIVDIEIIRDGKVTTIKQVLGVGGPEKK
ncbi:MAG: hypothetical protein BWX88_02541 [Planctomycetes bacterium ADurb.Bin126]|nr:MAG: hypothetical protein BWX88_02541 [Planctomycetes bacterium ADurb.Bin126]HOD81134.1 PDZ domain-containing protein [Phycisphaerae bacterium]HQL72657.1 PDZ domain-containing protein [Phycisphaerae bacterium]